MASLLPVPGAAAAPLLAQGVAACQCRHLSLGAAQHAAPDGLYGGQTLEEIRSRIFGTHIGNGLPSGRKLLRKKLVGEKIANYYEVPIEKTDPLFESLDDERCAMCSKLCGLHAEAGVYCADWFAERFHHSRHASQAQDEAGQAQTARQGTAQEGCWQALVKALTL